MSATTHRPEECPCPVCARPGRRLQSVSDASFYIDYYRCPVCGHVWTVPKDECEPADNVTVRAS